MVQAGYTTDRLLQIGRSNYDRYAFFVKIWNCSGLWEQARQVMKQSAKNDLRSLRAVCTSDFCSGRGHCDRKR